MTGQGASTNPPNGTTREDATTPTPCVSRRDVLCVTALEVDVVDLRGLVVSRDDRGLDGVLTAGPYETGEADPGEAAETKLRDL